MAKITALPRADAVSGMETLPVVQDGETRRVPLAGLVGKATPLRLAEQQPAIQPIVATRSGGIFLGINLEDQTAVIPLSPSDPGIRRALDQNVAVPGAALRRYSGSEAVMPIIVAQNGTILLGWDIEAEIGVGPLASGASVGFDTYLPNDPRLLVSDHSGIAERSIHTLRFVRALADTPTQSYEDASPGSRVSFYTTASIIHFDLWWNNLVVRDTNENSVGAIMVDGEVAGTFASIVATNAEGPQTVTLELGSSALREVALVWPYGAGMELRQTRLAAGAALALGAPRPAGWIISAGDSTTEGFSANGVATSWPFLYANLADRQLANLGHGGHQAVASEGTVAGQVAAPAGALARIIYSMGINDCIAGKNPAVFKAAVAGWLANARAEAPLAEIRMVSAFYCPAHETAHAFPLSAYRDAFAQVVAEAANPLVTYVDGSALITHSPDRFVSDLTHPNDLGSSEVATNLQDLDQG
ncbi:SGNH/GDSL hydrolase family protein [Sphingomonas psychrotolerans]|uniref:SGNH/GDSL hydrolase family protein n=1 Tax=Sphingomonas psychrotolerans TaxID=1327635 RepID=A0ABU3N393_9SPHN|nr:SGNH/GDSL hydrolase family protein [Sphingomonas psychrotolerans]MDT8758237.1 SGNH/GDSL hydrolase family protein [Sphingomonas psychrotolerans]